MKHSKTPYLVLAVGALVAVGLARSVSRVVQSPAPSSGVGTTPPSSSTPTAPAGDLIVAPSTMPVLYGPSATTPALAPPVTIWTNPALSNQDAVNMNGDGSLIALKDILWRVQVVDTPVVTQAQVALKGARFQPSMPYGSILEVREDGVWKVISKRPPVGALPSMRAALSTPATPDALPIGGFKLDPPPVITDSPGSVLVASNPAIPFSGQRIRVLMDNGQYSSFFGGAAGDDVLHRGTSISKNSLRAIEWRLSDARTWRRIWPA